MGIGVGIGIGFKLAAAVKALLAAGAIVAVVSILSWERLKEWFQARQALTEADADNVAFSLAEKMDSGQYKTVYGVFNKRKETLVEAEAVISKSLDEELRQHHLRDPLVVYR